MGVMAQQVSRLGPSTMLEQDQIAYLYGRLTCKAEFGTKQLAICSLRIRVAPAEYVLFSQYYATW